MTYLRKTLSGPVSVEGVGLHTGVPVKMTVHPGDSGIWFRLGSERVQARPDSVSDTTRSTKLGAVGTVEHLMSAFCGLEITDAEVELDAPEVPGLDGSSLPFIELITDIGLETIGEHHLPDLYRRIFFQEEELKVSVGRGTGAWRYTYATGERWPGEQTVFIEDVVASYESEIAPNRTFTLMEEIPLIIQAGLGKGLDESSVLVLGIEGYKNDARSPEEPARHKLLDLMGDLYLSGIPARALSVVAERSGHRANVKVAAMLLESILQPIES